MIIAKPYVNIKAYRRFLHSFFELKTSPLFKASNQGSEIAIIARSRAKRRCADIDRKRSAIMEKLHHKFLY
jgi:hypothetical protein